MKYLLPAYEPEERVDLLLQLTKFSELHQKAIKLHLCRGYSEHYASECAGIKQQHFNRSLSRLNEIAGIVERINQLSGIVK